MGLTWSISKVANSDSLYLGSEAEGWTLNRATEALVWATVAVGLNEITAKNLDQWVARLAMMSRIGWCVMTEKTDDGFKRCNPTPGLLERHIGLSTNASRLTDAEFFKKLREKLEDTAKRAVEDYHAAKAVTV